MSRSGRARSAVLIALLAASPGCAGSANGPADAETRAREAVETYTRALETTERSERLALFRGAARLFADVASRGAHNAELYTSWGNAALQSEDLGGAVLAYRRALQLEPTHPRAVQNLAHARSRLPGWVPRPAPPGWLDSFFAWHHTLSASARALASALAFALAAALISAQLRWGTAGLRAAALLPALACAALVGSLARDALAPPTPAAVVLAREGALARSADSALAPPALPEPLPAGTELEIRNERDAWLQVRLASGRDVWLPRSAVGRVSPE